MLNTTRDSTIADGPRVSGT